MPDAVVTAKADRHAVLAGVDRPAAIDARGVDAEIDVGHQRAEQHDAVAPLDMSRTPSPPIAPS